MISMRYVFVVVFVMQCLSGTEAGLGDQLAKRTLRNARWEAMKKTLDALIKNPDAIMLACSDQIIFNNEVSDAVTLLNIPGAWIWVTKVGKKRSTGAILVPQPGGEPDLNFPFEVDQNPREIWLDRLKNIRLQTSFKYR